MLGDFAGSDEAGETKMSVRNELYDPDSDAIHDRHSAERERLSRLLYGDSRRVLPEEQRAAAKAAFDHHHLACLRTFVTCHETVQGYARWLFGMGTWPGGRAPEVDWEELRSVEEARTLYVRLMEKLGQAEHAKVASLPVAQPAGLEAFEGPGVGCGWQRYTGKELRSAGGSAQPPIWTLITMHRRAGVWHVCFMQEWPCRGVSVINGITELATLVYREMLAEAGRAPKQGLHGMWLPTPRSLAVHPSQLRFYTHLPAWSSMPEEFDLVAMRYHGGRFRSPQRVSYKSIPRAIALARGEAGDGSCSPKGIEQ